MKSYNKFVTIILCCIIGLFTLLNILVINNIVETEHNSLLVYIASYGSIFCYCVCNLYVGKNKPTSKKGFVFAIGLPGVVMLLHTVATYTSIFSIYYRK